MRNGGAIALGGTGLVQDSRTADGRTPFLALADGRFIGHEPRYRREKTAAAAWRKGDER
jgi:hypothetical protein